MTGREFLNTVAHGESDILQLFLNIIKALRTPYCLIGGLAVNAYVEPVVSLDLDIVVAIESVKKICDISKRKGFKVKKHEHSINLTSTKSNLRIQVQTDVRYQSFITRAKLKQVLGYKMKVAMKEDVLQGKVWAYLDKTRRMSKRQKDLADIMRLVETYPNLIIQLPIDIKEKLNL
jgi:hypothetical protein